MSEALGLVRSFFQFLLRHKGKIALIPLIALGWALVLFPYSDIRSFVATTLSRSMGEGFAIDFEHVNLSWGFPVALELEGFEIEGPGLPPVAADRLVARPSLGALIRQSPGGSVEAEGLYGAQVSAQLLTGAKLKGGQLKQELLANIAGLELGVLTDSLRRAGFLSFVAQGNVDTNVTASIDPLFEEQPDANITLQGKAIAIPSVAIPIPNMGPVQTPSVQLSKFDFKGRLNDGKILIEDLSFGQPKDSFSGRVRGEFGLIMRRDAQGTHAAPGPYDLRIELSVSRSMMDAMAKSGVGLAFLMIEKFKVEAPDALKYAFRMRAPGVGITPNFDPIASN